MNELNKMPEDLSAFLEDIRTTDPKEENQLVDDLENLTKQKDALIKQQKLLNQKKELVEEELSSMDRSINLVQASIEENESRKTELIEQVEILQADHEKLISDINHIQSLNKATSIDLENSQHVIDTLTNELEEFESERSIAMERIQMLRNAIQSIAYEKNRKLPKLKHYEGMLKRAYAVFQETENRMELSLKLKDVP